MTSQIITMLLRISKTLESVLHAHHNLQLFKHLWYCSRTASTACSTSNKICYNWNRLEKWSFNSSWCAKYKWLEYSVIKDSAFCYPCQFFAHTSGRKSETFTKIGFCNWKHATGKDGIVVRHDHCNRLKQAMCSWSNFVKILHVLNLLLNYWTL